MLLLLLRLRLWLRLCLRLLLLLSFIALFFVPRAFFFHFGGFFGLFFLGVVFLKVIKERVHELLAIYDGLLLCLFRLFPLCSGCFHLYLLSGRLGFAAPFGSRFGFCGFGFLFGGCSLFGWLCRCRFLFCRLFCSGFICSGFVRFARTAAFFLLRFFYGILRSKRGLRIQNGESQRMLVHLLESFDV